MQPNEQGLEQVEGHRIVELLQATPLEPLDEGEGAPSNGTGALPPRTAMQVRVDGLSLVAWNPVAACPPPCSHVHMALLRRRRLFRILKVP